MTAEPRPKTLQLVADDYGLRPAVDAAILALARDRRLSSVSCMVHADRWPEAAARLRELPIAAGLHLNLTEGVPLSRSLRRHWPQLPTLPRLLWLAQRRQLPGQALRDEIAAQLDACAEALGRPLRHLDGHQHVHSLPGVADALREVLDARPPLPVRRTDRLPGPGASMKRRLIGHLSRAARQAVWQNEALLGAYDFRCRDYGRLMRAWLDAAPARGGLIFCHPGEGTAAPGDAIAAARDRERQYLASARFVADLVCSQVRLLFPGP